MYVPFVTEGERMKYAKTVNLTYSEKKALERKYKKIINREARSKKVTVSKVPQENEDGVGGGFFKYAYRYYFLLDLPARDSFKLFCCVMRTADEAKAAAYLLIRGEDDRKNICEAVVNATFGYSFGIDEKFDYLKKMCFGRTGK